MDQNTGHRQRLKERFTKAGPKAFSDHELLELLLTYALPRKDTKEIAKLLLRKYKSLQRVFATPQKELESIKGLGESSAILLSLIQEFMVKGEHELLEKKTYISGPEDIIPLMRTQLKNKSKEVFAVIYLDPQSQILEIKIMHEGTVDQAHVYIREIAEHALLTKASRIIAVHNHPSGNPNPSQADKDITKALNKALSLLSMELLDHLIIAGDLSYSFRNHNLL